MPDAFSMRRCGPPCIPIGNMVWEGALAERSLAFSGLAIRDPILVTERGLTLTPVHLDTASMTVVPSRGVRSSMR